MTENIVDGIRRVVQDLLVPELRELRAEFNAQRSEVDKRLDAMDKRLDAMDQKADARHAELLAAFAREPCSDRADGHARSCCPPRAGRGAGDAAQLTLSSLASHRRWPCNGTVRRVFWSAATATIAVTKRRFLVCAPAHRIPSPVSAEFVGIASYGPPSVRTSAEFRVLSRAAL